MGHKEALIRHPCMPVHSLVANVLPIVIISKVVTIKDPLKLNHDSKTSEHHIPRVPAHVHYSLQAGHTCMCVVFHICVHSMDSSPQNLFSVILLSSCSGHS